MLFLPASHIYINIYWKNCFMASILEYLCLVLRNLHKDFTPTTFFPENFENKFNLLYIWDITYNIHIYTLVFPWFRIYSIDLDIGSRSTYLEFDIESRSIETKLIAHQFCQSRSIESVRYRHILYLQWEKCKAMYISFWEEKVAWKVDRCG